MAIYTHNCCSALALTPTEGGLVCDQCKTMFPFDIINLTTHEITLQQQDGTKIVFPPSGQVARVEQPASDPAGEVKVFTGTGIGAAARLPLVGRPKRGKIINLPEPTPGVLCIVSGLVFEQTDRNDIIAPATGDADRPIRNERGHIVAVTKFHIASGQTDDV